MKLEVGQKIWVVHNNFSPIYGIIEKIGRKWVTFEQHWLPRMNLNTFKLEAQKGQCSPGKCYLSKEEYDNELAAKRAWRDFQSRISSTYNMPEYMTVERIENALLCLVGESE